MTDVDIASSLSDFFSQDHRDCDARWADVEELLDTSDIVSARPVWEKYRAGMIRHLAMEEDVLFPAFERVSGMAGSGSVAVSKMEHQQLRGLLDQVGECMDKGNVQEALDIGDTLLILIQQHNDKEENELYPMAERMLAGEWAGLVEHLSRF